MLYSLFFVMTWKYFGFHMILYLAGRPSRPNYSKRPQWTVPLPLIVFNDPDSWTIPVGVTQFHSQYGADTARVLAYVSLAMVPALAFYAVAERQLVGGLASGATKG